MNITKMSKSSSNIIEEPLSLSDNTTILTEMAEKSKKVMSEFNTFFKSKTLEKLYTPEYQYNGTLPNSTYIIDKNTGKKKLITITSSDKGIGRYKIAEKYIARTTDMEPLGIKEFDTLESHKRIDWGYMESYNNQRYAGTQIRLTQIEVERAMQINADFIPLFACAEALPFHAMMGFKPNKYKELITTVNDVNIKMEELKKKNKIIRNEFFTPIIHQENDKFYFDENQTIANAIIRQLKYYTENGIQRDFHAIYDADMVSMNLSGKELEAWKQRALSQPILLKKKQDFTE